MVEVLHRLDEALAPGHREGHPVVGPDERVEHHAQPDLVRRRARVLNRVVDQAGVEQARLLARHDLHVLGDPDLALGVHHHRVVRRAVPGLDELLLPVPLGLLAEQDLGPVDLQAGVAAAEK